MLWRVWRALRHPVHPENRDHLAMLWLGLPEGLRGPRQMIGRQAEGCGATVGVQPSCDLDCTGCYLSDDANRVPAESVEAVREQLRRLRRHLGRFGNVQITDGEVTLRDADELVRILRFATEIELIPMLMTHGGVLLRRPELLRRLVVEGGLREVSFHVDVTQRGRREPEFAGARTEGDLNPLRDRFAELLRDVRRSTGVPLRVASTVTVTRESLAGVPAILEWALRNPDVLRIVSFQPMAQVGRTDEGLGGGVDADELWRKIALGLLGDEAGAKPLEAARRWFGHPECSRVVMGVSAVDGEGPAVYHPFHGHDEQSDREFLEFLARRGGLKFRSDGRAEKVARAVGVLLRDARFLAGRLPRFTSSWLRRLDPQDPRGFARRLVLGRARLHGLAIVSHHFMSRAELETPLGRERLEACVFKVPARDGSMVPMCSFNAAGGRDDHYANQLRRTGLAPRPIQPLEPVGEPA